MIKVNYDEKTGRVIGFDLNKTPFIEITEEERRQPLPDRYSHYAVKNNKFIIERVAPSAEQLKAEKREKLQKELFEIKQWFNDNDWKVNKYVLQEWKLKDPRFIEYLQEREKKRARQDEINLELSK